MNSSVFTPREVKSSDELRKVAEVYKRAWDAGLSVTQAVADECYLSVGGAKKRIQRARKEGLLDGVGPKR